MKTPGSLRLMSDLNRNLLLLNQLYWQAGRKNDAQRVLLEALQLANRTGFISHFVIEGEVMAQQLRQLIQLNTLPELDQHRAQRILREINQHHRHKFAHFDENFVERLLNHPEVPELIRHQPAHSARMAVLGLIYSGYSNEQIAGELAVAATIHQNPYPQSLSEAGRGPSSGCGAACTAAAEDDGYGV